MLTKFPLIGQICFAVFFYVLVTTGSAVAQIQPGLTYDVYYLAGQSNATGRGDASELPSIQDGLFASPQTDVQFFYRATLGGGGLTQALAPQNQFIDLQSGTGQGRNNPSAFAREFGPELSLGRALADANPDRNIVIIKYSEGGTNLYSDWAAGGFNYTQLLAVSSQALGDITNAGASFNLKGFAWVQGEDDAGNGTEAPKLPSKLDRSN